jgi:hypothetical protein
MPNFEIVTCDEDLKEMTVFWNDQSQVFLTQVDTDDRKACTMLNLEEAKQTVAVLSAFIAGRLTHTSDCALHNSPAEPIEPCTCASA